MIFSNIFVSFGICKNKLVQVLIVVPYTNIFRSDFATITEIFHNPDVKIGMIKGSKTGTTTFKKFLWPYI